MESRKPNVVICAQVQSFVGSALALMLNEYNVVCCRHDDKETLSRLSGRPDVIVKLAPSTHSCRLAKQCKLHQEGVSIILVSQMWLEDEDAVRAAGFSGYLGPDCMPPQLVEAVRTVLQGGFFYHPGSRNRAALGKLSPRQVEVMRLVGFGFTDQEIAAYLGIGETTVRHHLNILHSKLKLERRGEIAAMAALGGLCEDLYRPPHDRNVTPGSFRAGTRRYLA
ncbi:MAG: LuxR C-terminal-related transcriptional regulator [Armatimonadota bacterium]